MNDNKLTGDKKILPLLKRELVALIEKPQWERKELKRATDLFDVYKRLMYVWIKSNEHCPDVKYCSSNRARLDTLGIRLIPLKDTASLEYAALRKGQECNR